jgi:hypothetical protein
VRKTVEEKATEAKAKTPDGRIEPYSDESEIDEEWAKDMDEEELKKLADEFSKIDENNEEEVLKFLMEKFVKDRVKIKDKRKKDEREEKDPYYKMMKDKTQQIVPASDGKNYHFAVKDMDNLHTLHDILEESIGRYPKAYRMYENYENYSIFHPESTPQDYHERSKYFPL